MAKMARKTMDTMCLLEKAGPRPDNLETLYAEYRERLLRFVAAKVGGDRLVAEDVVQEAFMAAMVSLAGFGARSSPYTWLCSIAQHKLADYYRKSLPCGGCNASTIELDFCADPEEEENCLSSVERWFERVETEDMVQNALHELPNIHRQVLYLKYFDGLTAAAIGEELGRSPKAVEGLLSRARHSLSRILLEAAPS